MELWGVVIAVIQPVSLLVAFESFMYQLRHRIAKSQQTAVNPWRIRAKVLIAYARCQQTAVKDLQGQNNDLQTAVKDLQTQNNKLFEANKELQTFSRRWQSIGNERQIVIRFNAGEISEQQAADMTGRDIRTIRTWSEQMNGAAK
jgi:FtsZ-binding cell division protein ZapB